MQHSYLDADTREMISAVMLDRYYLESTALPADELIELRRSVEGRMRELNELTRQMFLGSVRRRGGLPPKASQALLPRHRR
ncbi:hypothetical protein ACEUZ9_004639 [Paracoccus litorisediminis]|uniref:hypothetical protein n=1 Tax=Paracoccus litorisediminis TaxID=2006130 RepID=UPI00372F0691